MKVMNKQEVKAKIIITAYSDHTLTEDEQCLAVLLTEQHLNKLVPFKPTELSVESIILRVHVEAPCAESSTKKVKEKQCKRKD